MFNSSRLRPHSHTPRKRFYVPDVSIGLSLCLIPFHVSPPSSYLNLNISFIAGSGRSPTLHPSDLVRLLLNNGPRVRHTCHYNVVEPWCANVGSVLFQGLSCAEGRYEVGEWGKCEGGASEEDEGGVEVRDEKTKVFRG